MPIQAGANRSGNLRQDIGGGGIYLCLPSCLYCSSSLSTPWIGIVSERGREREREESAELEQNTGEWEEQRLTHQRVRGQLLVSCLRCCAGNNGTET